MEERDLQRSPSLARLLKRRPSFSRPPIRTLYSPKLTEDEAEMLTSPFLQYRTRYTYANSSCYDPDLPNSWEVPNLANAGLEINAPLSHIHLSSPSVFRVTWLYIYWIFEVIGYFVKKIFVTLFKEGPIAVLVVIYDLLSLIYLFCCSVVRRTAAFLRDSCYYTVSLFTLSHSVEDAEEDEGSFFRSIWETIVYTVLFPARAVYWALDRTGRSVLDLFYGKMSAKRYNLRPYRPQRRESEEAEEIAVNFGGDESISSINDDDDQYIQEAPTVRRRVQRAVHNLRSRVIRDEITDTEDEGFSEKRPIRLHTSTPIRRRDLQNPTLHIEDENERPPTKATKIAHALGYVSSTFVASIYWVAIEFLMIFSRIFHSAKTGAQRAVSVLTPNRNRKVMHTRKQQESTRRSTRFRPMVVDTDDEPEEYEENVHVEEQQSTKFPLLVSLSGFLLGSAKFFLSCCFAVVDLFRMARDSTLSSIRRLFSRHEQRDFDRSSPELQESSKRGGLLLLAPVEYVVNKTAPLLMAFGRIVFNVIIIPFAFFWWLGEYVYNGIKSSKKSKLLLWLLPLLLLLLILLARNSENKQYLAVGKQAEQLKERVTNYVAETWKSIDSEGAYAKSMNSIYDEYYSRGQYSVIGLADRVKNFFGSIFSFFSNIFYSIISLVQRFVSYIWELIIAFLNLFVQAWRQIVIFSKTYKVVAIPTMGSLKKTAYSYYEAIPPAPAMLYPSYYSEYVPTKEGISNYSVWLLSLPGVIYNNIKSHEVFEKSTEQTINVGTPVVPAAIPPPPAPTKEQVVKIVKEYIHVPAPAVEVPKIDEDKLIKEITAKVQAEMELKLEAFKASYQKEIKEISEINVKQNVEVDYSHLENLIRQAIYQYDADKTGLFDFALESAGASVISTRCSESYNTYSRLEKIWNIPLWYSSYGPRTVIQRNSNSLFPGECWSFKSGVGFLTVDLSHQINISSVSYEHIAKDQAPDGNRSSAPKTFKLWAYKTENDFQSRFLLGSFEYKLDEHPLQFFVIKRHPDFPVKIIEMEVTSNYGADFTCLYRLRVHGQIYRSP